MDYETCLKAVVAVFRTEGGANAEADIAIYSSYPIPTATEWADIVERTATYGDPENPFDCMGQYECRLSVRGFTTVLDAIVDEYKAIALSVGMPLEYLGDALELLELTRSKSPTGR